MDVWDPWTYHALGARPPTVGMNITGFDVEDANGNLGTVNEATYTAGSSYVVIDTGPWIFGRSVVVLPAGTIDRIDIEHARVYVDLTKDQITKAPPLDPVTYTSLGYRQQLGEYYCGFYVSISQ